MTLSVTERALESEAELLISKANHGKLTSLLYILYVKKQHGFKNVLFLGVVFGDSALQIFKAMLNNIFIFIVKLFLLFIQSAAVIGVCMSVYYAVVCSESLLAPQTVSLDLTSKRLSLAESEFYTALFFGSSSEISGIEMQG